MCTNNYVHASIYIYIYEYIHIYIYTYIYIYLWIHCDEGSWPEFVGKELRRDPNKMVLPGGANYDIVNPPDLLSFGKIIICNFNFFVFLAN